MGLFDLTATELIDTPQKKLTQDEIAAIQEKFAQQYSSMLTFECRMRQQVTLPDASRIIESSGMVYFQNPGYLRLQLDQPAPQWILMSPGQVIEQKSVGPITRREVHTASDRGPYGFLYSLLRGYAAAFDKDYEVSMYSNEKSQLLVVLVPRPDQLEESPQKITAVLDIQTLMLSAFSISFAEGGTWKLYLSDHRTDVPLERQLFTAPRPSPQKR